ncbi:uncharacterized protein LOC117903815 [Drosophila subobscura]|uniref:uncharacterized protein LOC117903815 n=1 Tax=Drosophila subobscura TaxID=7241 RepID=UPI00155AAAA9|nr:uncharacterized protein LOC117903815 [Drosophila subobscura]
MSTAPSSKQLKNKKMSALNIDGVCSVLSMLQGYLPFSCCSEQPKEDSIEENIFFDSAVVDPAAVVVEDISKSKPAAAECKNLASPDKKSATLKKQPNAADYWFDIGRRSHATYVFNGEYSPDSTFEMDLATLEEEWIKFMMRNVEPEPPMIVAPLQEYELVAEVQFIRFTLDGILWLTDEDSSDEEEDDKSRCRSISC